MTERADFSIAFSLDGESTPLHRALDHLSAALIETQRLQRSSGGTSGFAADLGRLEHSLKLLGDSLLELRDTSTQR